jgi:sec-independent protein translocase protein TatA
MFNQFGPLEIVLIIVVLLVIFGPKRLPSLGRSLGSGMREFKDSITGDDKRRADDDDEQPALAQAPKADAADAGDPAATPVDAAPERRA